MTVPISGYGRLEIRQELQQERLERLVGAVELVDQQHRGQARNVGFQRLQQRALDQEALREDALLDPLAVGFAGRLGDADVDHLKAVVPLIDRRGDVEPLIALQADQPPPQRLGQNLADLGLADPGLAFEEQRPLKPESEEQRRRQRPVGDVAPGGEQLHDGIDVIGQGLLHRRARAAHLG